MLYYRYYIILQITITDKITDIIVWQITITDIILQYRHNIIFILNYLDNAEWQN